AVPVSSNPTLLQQAIWNLADNALNYRRPEVPPEIEMRGWVEGRWYVLRISDNGLGMSTAEVEQAFEPFYRGESSRDRPGTGLGLSIVKRVVEASGGSVSLESQPEVGSSFVLRLPRPGET